MDHSRHMGDGQSFDAVRKTALQEVAAHERPRRIDDQFVQSDFSLPGHQLFGGERRVTVLVLGCGLISSKVRCAHMRIAALLFWRQRAETVFPDLRFAWI